MHWAARFVGWPYAPGAQGPVEWDCFAFFRAVQREQFGRDVPLVPSPVSWGGVAKAIPASAKEFGWLPTEDPKDGDAVILSRMREATHLGVWVADLKSALHCAEGSGSVLHTARHLTAAGWRVRGFYSPEA